MEIIAILIIIYALKKGVDDAKSHFGKSKAASRSQSAAKSGPKRTAAALHHDTGYWASQLLHGFPPARHGFASGWHAGRQAHEQGKAVREKAKADHLDTRRRLIPEIQEHRKRQQAALEEIRKAQTPEPESVHAKTDEEVQPTRRMDGLPETEADRRFFDLRERGYKGPIDQDGNIPDPADPANADSLAALAAMQRNGRKEGSADEGEGSPEDTSPGTETAPSTSPTEGSNGMATQQADTTYTQQMYELNAIRADAEEEVNSVRRKRMLNRLDILTGLGLDKDSLSEAAAIDDALREQEKAAQQTLDSADGAIQGLSRRHGGIQEAVSNAPIPEPAQPSFYSE